MAKKKTDTNRDELTGIIADSLNKKFNKTHHLQIILDKVSISSFFVLNNSTTIIKCEDSSILISSF